MNDEEVELPVDLIDSIKSLGAITVANEAYVD